MPPTDQPPQPPSKLLAVHAADNAFDAFDPRNVDGFIAKKTTALGFAGYDPETNNYKIEKLPSSPNVYQPQAATFARPTEVAVVQKQVEQSIDLAIVELEGAANSGILGRGTSTLVRFLTTSSAAGYIATRLGLPFGKSSDPLDKTYFLGILSEVRSGPVAGLRFVFDVVPSAKKGTATGDVEIDWFRFVLGYSFGYLIRNDRLRLDATPKLGSWSFHTKLPVDVGTDAAIVPFSITRRLTLGIELGIEWVYDAHTLRGWYGRDQVLPKLGPLGGDEVVNSNRLGLDYYFAVVRE